MSQKINLNESENHKKAKELIDTASKKIKKQIKITNLTFTLGGVFVFLIMHPLSLIISGYGEIEFNKAMLTSIVLCASFFIFACKKRAAIHKKNIDKIKLEFAEEAKEIDFDDEELRKSRMSFFKSN